MNTKPDLPPAEPLRLFLRGFLRDHLGVSNIVADSLSVIFQKRWLARNTDTETKDRYSREDVHTLAAAFDRRAIAEADKMTGHSVTDRDKAAAEKMFRSGVLTPAEATMAARTNFGLRRDTFEVPPGFEAARDGNGRATGGLKAGRSTAHVNLGGGPRDGGVPGIKPDPAARNYSAGR